MMVRPVKCKTSSWQNIIMAGSTRITPNFKASWPLLKCHGSMTLFRKPWLCRPAAGVCNRPNVYVLDKKWDEFWVFIKITSIWILIIINVRPMLYYYFSNLTSAGPPEYEELDDQILRLVRAGGPAVHCSEKLISTSRPQPRRPAH